MSEELYRIPLNKITTHSSIGKNVKSLQYSNVDLKILATPLRSHYSDRLKIVSKTCVV